MAGEVSRWVYQCDPDDSLSGQVNPYRCRYRLFEWRASQCSRRATTDIRGYGFCTKHAKIVRARMAQAERARAE